ncbi:MAG: TonB-dependent receptor [Acidobacteriota bacterium]|nr:TonB-dependent receptor [Acidobacteriota bacterium]
MSLRSTLHATLLLGLSVAAFGQSLAGIGGRVLDPAGTPIPDVAITLTNTATRTLTQVASDSNGNYTAEGLTPGAYSLRASKPGFALYDRSVVLQAGQRVAADVNLPLSAVQQTVVVNGGSLLGTTPEPSQTDVFLSEQTVRVIDRTQMDMLGPVAGAAQVINLAPGAQVTGYGNTGATKYTVSLNGISQGWGGYGGYTGGASLGITFDGIPIVDPATGLWQSATIPQMQIIQDTAITYGPGDPLHRWYTNVGGAVEFTPLQPGNQAHGDLMLTYGSYNQKNLQFDLSSPVYKGWSAILAGGGGLGDDFRNGPDGFNNPSKDLAIYGKTIKTFQQSSLDFGGYWAHSGGYRSQVIPTTPIDGITMDGSSATPLYSQQTSGFYSTLPFANYNKYDVNEMALLHARENIHIDDQTQLQNLSWFMHIYRLHDRLADVYNPGPQQDEWNDPHTNTYGDQVTLTRNLPMNLVGISASFVHAFYNTRNNFYDPADGGAGGEQVVNIGGKIRSGYFTQNDGFVALQDTFHPTSKLSITPGIRYSRFAASYYDGALQDFGFAPGVVLSSHCPTTLTSAPGNTKNQGANCANDESRYGFEPSISASYRALPWLTFYGGYQEALRSPSLGGGGGLFQSVDPYSYHLARARYGQFGFKVHTETTGALNNLMFGANLYRVGYSSQEIDIGLANGDTIAANGAARYQGLNYFLDDDPAPNLHVFVNGNVEGSHYTNYNVGGLAFDGSAVPYVPYSTLNIGATYHFKVGGVPVIPVAAFQYVGRQNIFDNTVGAPSPLTMPSYGTVNLGLTAPFKHFDLLLNALNLFNRQYNEYLYVSSGGYFGTPNGGYELAYPAAPFTIYGSVRFHF